MTMPRFPTGLLRQEALNTQRHGVWGVRNYHTTLEQRAISGGTLTGGYFAMVLAATVMATAGLLLNSSAAIIGSMCVAPFMAPSRAVCIGMLFKNWGVFSRGLIKQFLGLLVIGSSVAALITVVLRMYLPDIDITPEILLRAMPTTKDVVLSTLIALSAGAAASLALVAQPSIVESPWGQVIDAIIGVEVAISLVPPAAVIGIGWALGKPEHSLNAFYLLLLNLAALDFIGSFTILAIRGVSRRHLELEKEIRHVVAETLHVVPGFTAVDSTVNVTLRRGCKASVGVILRLAFGGEVPKMLANQIAQDILAKTSFQSDVTVEIIPILTHKSIA